MSRLELEQEDWKQKAYMPPCARVELGMWMRVYAAAAVHLVPFAKVQILQSVFFVLSFL